MWLLALGSGAIVGVVLRDMWDLRDSALVCDDDDDEGNSARLAKRDEIRLCDDKGGTLTFDFEDSLVTLGLVRGGSGLLCGSGAD